MSIIIRDFGLAKMTTFSITTVIKKKFITDKIKQQKQQICCTFKTRFARKSIVP